MKRKGLIFILLTLVCLLFVLPSNKDVKANSEAWTLVTDVNELAIGDQVVIVAKDSNFAMNTTQGSNNRGRASVTKSNDKSSVTFGADVQKLTLKAGTTTGTFAFYTGDKGYLYCASTSSKNYLRTQTALDAKASWTIEIAANGQATIKSKVSGIDRNMLQYNSNNGIFACYSSTQQAICLYKFVETTTPDTPVVPDEPVVEVKEIEELFEEYYNNGNYTRETVINVNTNNSTIVANLQQFFHASEGAVKRLEEPVTTYFAKKGTEECLWFNDADGYGHGYGTQDGKLTTINVSKAGITVKGINNLPGMEEYYCTLHDFKEGSHTSSHTNNRELKGLNVNDEWTYDEVNKFYYNESSDVIDAFILFTAPTWLPLTNSSVEKYVTFVKAVIKEESDSLVMQLIAENDEGKLIEGANNVFSEAKITKGTPSFGPEDVTYKYTFVSNDIKDKSSSPVNLKLSNVEWLAEFSGSTYFGFTSGKGLQIGSGNAPMKSFNLTSAEFTNVKKIVVNASGASGISGSFTVYVDGVKIGQAKTLTTTATNYEFNLDVPTTGEVVISFTNTAKAMYIQSIQIDYQKIN